MRLILGVLLASPVFKDKDFIACTQQQRVPVGQLFCCFRHSSLSFVFYRCNGLFHFCEAKIIPSRTLLLLAQSLAFAMPH